MFPHAADERAISHHLLIRPHGDGECDVQRVVDRPIDRDANLERRFVRAKICRGRRLQLGARSSPRASRASPGVSRRLRTCSQRTAQVSLSQKSVISKASSLLSEVVRAGISLLQRAEKARAALPASVLAAEEAGDRDGYLTADELVARVEARLARRSTRPK